MKSRYFLGNHECFYNEISGFTVLCITQCFVLIRLISTWRMTAALVPAQLRPSKSFNFSGSKGEKRSFRAQWCQQFEWLHYDVGKDAVGYGCESACRSPRSWLSRAPEHGFPFPLSWVGDTMARSPIWRFETWEAAGSGPEAGSKMWVLMLTIAGLSAWDKGRNVIKTTWNSISWIIN